MTTNVGTFFTSAVPENKLLTAPKQTLKLNEIKQICFELPTNQLSPQHIDALNRDFDDIYGQAMRQDKVYNFSSEAEATQFFKQQADLGRSFLVKNTNKDSMMYSDGEKRFFSGKQDKLDNFLEAVLNTPFSLNSASKPAHNGDIVEADSNTSSTYRS